MGYRLNVFTGNLDLVGTFSMPPGSVTSSSGSSTDNGIVTFDGTTGMVIQGNSSATVDDSGNITATSFIGSGTALTGVEKTANKGVANGYASLDSNALVPITQIPPAALERLIVVADQTARFALTTATAQNGDSVLQTDTNTMYMVKDDTNLGNASGYQVYSAGTAVNFSGVLSGDVTGGQSSTLVSKIQGTTVSGTTGSGNVVFSASPTLTGTLTAGAANLSGALSASNFSGSSSGTNTGDQTITLTGDVTGSGTSSFATTLATVNANVGSFGSSTSIPSITVNAKGLITAASGNAVIAPAGTLSGTTLNPTVVSSSLTSVGTITSGTWNGSVVDIAHGGTNSSTALNNNRVMQSSGGAIVEAAAITAARALKSDANGIPVASTATAASLDALSGTNTGDQTITLTGDVTGSGTGSFAATIANSAVTNAKMANMAAHTYKGNNTGSPSAPLDVTSTQVTADLNLFTTSLQGLVPASGGGTTNFLRADGTFSPVAGANGGTVTSVSVVSTNGLAGTVATATTTPAITLSTTVTGLLKGNGTAISAAVSGTDYQPAGNYPIASTGDLNETSFTAADNQVAAANVTGLAFANGTVRSFEVILSIVRNNTYAQYTLNGIQRAADWAMTQSDVGDVTGLTFTITTAGQVQYTSSSTGFTSLLKFRAWVTQV